MTNYEALEILRDTNTYDCDRCSRESCDECKLTDAMEKAMEGLRKLDKIENIIEAYKTDNPKEPYYDSEVYMNNIVEALENE